MLWVLEKLWKSVFHDVLSRKGGYRYLDWLLNVVEENKIEVIKSK